MDKNLINQFKDGIAEADAKMENRLLANDNLQAMNLLTSILEMPDEEFAEQAELMEEILRLGIDKTSLTEKVSQMNALGQTTEDLVRDNIELEEFQNFDFEQIGVNETKAKLLRGLVSNLIELNNTIIRFGIRPHVNIYYTKLHNDAIIPKYANYNDAGFDIYTLEDTTIREGTAEAVRTGLAVAIPDGYEIQIRPRSGWSLKKENAKVFIANAPGTIDAGYRDELKIIVKNLGDFAYFIPRGTRIAQGVLMPVPQAEFLETEDVKMIGINRNGGFGSTGDN